MLPTIILGLVSLIPLHDFHTSVMNFKYQDDEKQFEIDLILDSEHFEYVIDNSYDVSVRLGETDEDPACDKYIETYLNEHISLWMNGKKQELNLLKKEVNYSETKLIFSPICQKKKLKQLKMENDFMLYFFPGQKNLVNYYYKGSKNSMLFLLNKDIREINFNQ